MVAGLPVFASDIKGHKELKNKLPEEKDPIFLIPHDDPKKAAEIIKMVVDTADIKQKSLDACYIAENLFNRQLEFRKLIEAYNKL